MDIFSYRLLRSARNDARINVFANVVKQSKRLFSEEVYFPIVMLTLFFLPLSLFAKEHEVKENKTSPVVADDTYTPFALGEKNPELSFDEFVDSKPLEVLDSLPPKDKYVRTSILIIPTIMYQPETSFQFGGAYGFYFRSKDPARVSSIVGSAVYSLKNQFIFIFTSKYYSEDRKFFLFADSKVRIFPDYYYGTGSDTTGIGKPAHYSSTNFYVTLQPQYCINKYWNVGGWMSIMGEWVNQKESDLPPDLTGRDKYVQVGVGPMVQYDSRDNAFWPTKGMFFRAGYWYYGKFLGSSYNIHAFNIDFRQCVPLFKKKFPSVFTWQFLVDARIGNQIPFQMLPTLGGRDILRGERQGVYRDNVMYALQAEYRFPIWGPLKGVVFCSIGDVMNIPDFKFHIPKVAFGIGLRLRINQNQTHFRLDFGMNQDFKTAFYFHAVEAY